MNSPVDPGARQALRKKPPERTPEVRPGTGAYPSAPTRPLSRAGWLFDKFSWFGDMSIISGIVYYTKRKTKSVVNGMNRLVRS
ncbi:hypothetical protein NN561_003795 [Cricetulus griseus]